MNKFYLSFALAVIFAALSTPLEAQTLPGTCGPEISGTECMSDWNSDAYNGNESATIKKCPENRDYTSCVNKCGCEYTNNRTRCKRTSCAWRSRRRNGTPVSVTAPMTGGSI